MHGVKFRCDTTKKWRRCSRSRLPPHCCYRAPRNSSCRRRRSEAGASSGAGPRGRRAPATTRERALRRARKRVCRRCCIACPSFQLWLSRWSARRRRRRRGTRAAPRRGSRSSPERTTGLSARGRCRAASARARDGRPRGAGGPRGRGAVRALRVGKAPSARPRAARGPARAPPGFRAHAPGRRASRKSGVRRKFVYLQYTLP